MRRIGTTGAFIAVFLLVRCGEAERAPLSTSHESARFGPTAALAIVLIPTPSTQPVLAPVAEIQPPRQPMPFEIVRGLARSLGTPGCGCGRSILVDETGAPLPGQEPRELKELRELGEIALAGCEFILSDPGSTWEEVNGVCDILGRLETGRRFVPLLAQRLTAPDAMVSGDATFDDTRKFIRRTVIEVLEDIGDERDAAAFVRVLHENDQGSEFVAARAIAKLGGPRELEAMNAWIALQHPRAPAVARIKKYRDELEKRLLSQPTRRTF